ncbi:MAG: hypothetical protein ACKONH_01985, partial [Planctomycetia bacterium]
VSGVGRFAADRAAAALGTDGPPFASMRHPSPASPAANRGWAAAVERQLREQGIELPAGRRPRPPRHGAVRRRGRG